MTEWGIRPWLLGLPMPPRTRARLLRFFGASIGRNVRVHPLTVMNAEWSNLVVEDDVYLGPDVLLDLSGRLTFGRGSVLAARVSLATHQDAGTAHGSPTAARLGAATKPVEIGRYAFVGIGAVILAGCRIGEGAVVGAGAVVIGDVPDGVTVVGVPAAPRSNDVPVTDAIEAVQRVAR